MRGTLYAAFCLAVLASGCTADDTTDVAGSGEQDLIAQESGGATAQVELTFDPEAIAGSATSVRVWVRPEPGVELAEVRIDAGVSTLQLLAPGRVGLGAAPTPLPSEGEREEGSAEGVRDGVVVVDVPVVVPADHPAGVTDFELEVAVCGPDPCTEDGESQQLSGAVEVIVPSSDTVPARLTTPAPVDIDVAGGIPVVRNQLLASLDPSLDAADRAATIVELATDVDAVVVGGQSEVGVYQLRIDVGEVDALLEVAERSAERWADRVWSVMLNTASSPARVPQNSYGRGDWDAPDRDRTWHWQVLSMPEAWAVTTGSRDVIIAVVDTGFNPSHRDLEPNVVEHYTRVDIASEEERTESRDLIDGEALSDHGSHVSALACGSDQHRRGKVVGGMWDCQLKFYELGVHPFGVPDDVEEGARSAEPIWADKRLAALSLAARRQPDVINHSYAATVGCDGLYWADAGCRKMPEVRASGWPPSGAGTGWGSGACEVVGGRR